MYPGPWQAHAPSLEPALPVRPDRKQELVASLCRPPEIHKLSQLPADCTAAPRPWAPHLWWAFLLLHHKGLSHQDTKKGGPRFFKLGPTGPSWEGKPHISWSHPPTVVWAVMLTQRPLGTHLLHLINKETKTHRHGPHCPRLPAQQMAPALAAWLSCLPCRQASQEARGMKGHPKAAPEQAGGTSSVPPRWVKDLPGEQGATWDPCVPHECTRRLPADMYLVDSGKRTPAVQFVPQHGVPATCPAPGFSSFASGCLWSLGHWGSKPADGSPSVSMLLN